MLSIIIALFILLLLYCYSFISFLLNFTELYCKYQFTYVL